MQIKNTQNGYAYTFFQCTMNTQEKSTANKRKGKSKGYIQQLVSLAEHTEFKQERNS